MSYSLDWALPAAMPLFAGAAVMESVQEADGTFSALADAMTGISEVVLESSMMSSLDDLNCQLELCGQQGDISHRRCGDKLLGAICSDHRRKNCLHYG